MGGREERLYMKLSKGRRDEISRIYDLHGKAMFAVAYSVLGNKAEAEDAVQDAFVTLLKYSGEIRQPESPRAKSFVTVITKNKAFDLLRKRKNEAELADAEAADVEQDVLELLCTKESEEQIIAAINAMDQRYSSVLYCVLVLECSTKKAARLLGRKHSTVRSQLKRGKALLAEGLRKGYFDEKR